MGRGARAGMLARRPRCVGYARGCRVRTKGTAPCVAKRQRRGVRTGERTGASYRSRFAQSNRDHRGSPSTLMPYIGKTPDGLHTYGASQTMPREIERSGRRAAGCESAPNTPFQRCGIVRRLQSCFRKASSSSSGRKRWGALLRGLVFARACSFNARSASR